MVFRCLICPLPKTSVACETKYFLFYCPISSFFYLVSILVLERDKKSHWELQTTCVQKHTVQLRDVLTRNVLVHHLRRWLSPARITLPGSVPLFMLRWWVGHFIKFRAADHEIKLVHACIVLLTCLPAELAAVVWLLRAEEADVCESLLLRESGIDRIPECQPSELHKGFLMSG